MTVTGWFWWWDELIIFLRGVRASLVNNSTKNYWFSQCTVYSTTTSTSCTRRTVPFPSFLSHPSFLPCLLFQPILFSSHHSPLLFFFFFSFSGQILNRFTKDLGQIDEMLPITVFDVITVSILKSMCLLLACSPK